MTSSIAIRSLSMEQIRRAIVEALRSGVDGPVLDDFLASVNWTGHREADSIVCESLGELEQWATLYREGELTVAAYVTNLVSVLNRSGSLA